MSAHPLTKFINETFGEQFGSLILAGYKAEPDGKRRRVYLTESEAGTETDWVIELVSSRLPCGEEPLVLAALLKLLLSRPVISNPLEFEMGELLAELRWPDDSDTRRQVEEAIVGCASLLYDKRVDARAGRRTSAISEGGCYNLLTSYVRGAESGTGGVLVRTSRVVYFDSGFICGLKEGRVCFAGIDFGPLQATPGLDVLSKKW
ncbi:MAG TPA: hypothetical protein VLJ61_01260 [Pyrinomonadaceae bacterium]|nr:hypothetical protein [Pyrinomonadaceae bacterium]